MRKIFGILVLLVGVVFVSCQKDAEISTNFDNLLNSGLSEKSAQIVMDEISVENVMAEMDFECDFYIGAQDVLTGMSNQGKKWGWQNSLRYKVGQCPNFSVESEEGGYPKTITLDYGDGTELNNGRILSGIIVIYISSQPNTDGFMKEVTYTNFSVDSLGIAGTTTMEFVGDRQSDNSHIVSADLIITLADGTIIHRVGERVRERIAGEDSELDQNDDVFKVTGYVENNVNESEAVYRKDITEALIKTGDCRYFSEGVVVFSQDGTVLATLDYGDGTCDEFATLTKDGEDPVEIDLSENEHRMNKEVRNGGKGQGNGKNKGQGNGHGQGNSQGHGNGQGNGNG